MMNTDKLNCLAVKECILNGLIEIDELSEKELDALIDFETDIIIESKTEPDTVFIDMCYDAMKKFTDSNKDVSDEEIRRIGNKVYAEFAQKQIISAPKKKGLRFVKRAATVLAATIIVAFMSFSVAAIALGGYSAAWHYVEDHISEILNLKCTTEVDGITIIKPQYTKHYDTIEELLEKENLDILYPSALPDGVKIEKIYIKDYETSGLKITVSFNDITINYSVKNYYSSNLDLFDKSSIYTSNGVEFFINNLDNQDNQIFQAIAQFEGNEYAINCENYEQLIFIINNLKGLTK